jgi:diguanylate cyclase (GGDEF)-like protein
MTDRHHLHDTISRALRLCQQTIFPPVMGRLLNEAMQPDPDPGKIADIIRTDPPFTALVLALANSAYYNLTSPVSDIQRAAAVLGNKELVKLILFASFQTHLNAFSRDRDLMAKLWNATIWGATAAEVLASRLDPPNSSKTYICVLLKDLARILLAAQGKLPYPVEQLATFTPQQEALEREQWGTTHEVLTKELLDQWNMPEVCSRAILAHHDINHLDQYPSGVQAAILGTRWAEVEFPHRDNPEQVLQFSFFIQNILGLTSEEFLEIRNQITHKFRALCQTMDIPLTSPDKRFFDHSITTLQRIYFLSMDIRHAQKGVSSVVKAMGVHLKMYWGIETWDVALGTHFPGKWALYHNPMDNKDPAIISPQDIPWRCQGPIMDIPGEGRPIGLFRLDSAQSHLAENEELQLYFRFAGLHFEAFLQDLALTDCKARTLDAIPIGVALLDHSGTIMSANAHFKSFYPDLEKTPGISLATMLAQGFGYPHDAELSAYFAHKDVKEYARIFCPLKRDNESCIYLCIHRQKDDSQAQHIALVEDISKVRSIEFDILKQRAFLHNLISSMQDIVLTVDKTGRISFVSPTGPSAWKGKNLFEIAQPESRAEVQWDTSLFHRPGQPVEVCLKESDPSHPQCYELVISRLTSSPTQYLVVARDVSLIRRLEKKLKQQARFDGLTNVFNRRQFDRALAREVAASHQTGRPLGMIFFDVDNFKGFNDQHGHQAGDKVLTTVGKILRSNTRQGMDIPCRYGGDEFVVLATDIERSPLQNLATRIKEHFDSHFADSLSLSTGVALLKSGENPEQFLLRADKASYAAKAQGGNTIVIAE